MRRSSIWMLTLVAVLSFTLIGCDLVSIPGMSKPDVSVTILVSDLEGKPMEFVLVNVDGKVDITGNDGKVLVTNVRRDAIVQATLPGWSVFPDRLVVKTNGETLRFFATKQETGSEPGDSTSTYLVKGRVVDEQGQGIPSAIITFAGATTVTVITGSDGSFTCAGLTGAYAVTSGKTGYSIAGTYNVTGREDNLVFVAEKHLPAHYGVSGIVIDREGNPLDKVLIMLSDEVGTVRTVVTDVGGLFSMSDLAGIVTITAAKPGWRFQPQTIVVNAGTASADFHGTPSEDTSYQLSGYILMSGGPNNGSPVGAVVLKFEFLDIPSRDPLVTITKADGSWQMDGLVGRVRVTPTKDGHSFTPGSQVIDKPSVTVGFAAHD